jgi:hypothetical protein
MQDMSLFLATRGCFVIGCRSETPGVKRRGLRKGYLNASFCLVGFSIEEQQRYGLQERLDATLI